MSKLLILIASVGVLTTATSIVLTSLCTTNTKKLLIPVELCVLSVNLWNLYNYIKIQ